MAERVYPADVRPHAIIFWMFAVALLFGVSTSPAAAQGDACDRVPLDGSTSGEPGQQLADAIGAQGEAIGTELSDRAFEARLENATSEQERARIIANETARIEARIDTLEACWNSLQSTAESNESNAVDPEHVEILERHANALYQHLNLTENEAATLDSTLRSEFGIDESAIASMDKRLAALRADLSRPGNE